MCRLRRNSETTAAIGRTRFRVREYRPTAVHVAIEAIADPAALAKPIVEITREDPAQKQSAGKEPGQQPTGINLDRAPPQRTLKLRDPVQGAPVDSGSSKNKTLIKN
ncbi:hypothetical protein BH18ACI4_BH18ACI4_28270 [soil metagenome]